MNRNESNPNLLDDSVLIRRFLENDMASFERLVVKYQDMIFNLCFRMLQDYDEANDSAQETFIKAYCKLKNFRFESNFSTWLYRIAVNTCRNRMTSAFKKVQQRSIPIGTSSSSDRNHIDIEDLSNDPGSLYEKRELERMIHEAIVSLPKSLRVLTVLRDMEGKSYEEISMITGVTIGTVKSRLARARHILRERLKELKFR